MAIVDPGLQRKVDEALALGFGCFGDGDHAPFIMLTETSGKGHLIDLKSADGTISEAIVEAGRGIIKQFAESGQYYILAWDGYLTRAGKRQDAVFAEAGACGEGQALVFAQRYKQAKSGALAKVGKPLVVAEVANLWAEAMG